MEFKNQSFSALLQELREDQFKPVRYNFNKEERDAFIKEHPLCSMCQNPFYMQNIHIDHIVPLVVGGDNELDNMEALCRPCHSTHTT